MTVQAAARPSVLIVIPCLNEADHMGALLLQLRRTTRSLDAVVVVVDGGSTDATRAIVEEIAAKDPAVVLLHNPLRIQGAAVNLAVRRFGAGREFLIRIDAHCRYPDDYCAALLEEARATGADSIVVSMVTEGSGLVQRAAAIAQNSRLGTGGSPHRHASSGAWVDHGHHALMRVAAFSAVGGYDESFRQNEDAELDVRLRAAGHRIWLSGRTHVVYYPRATIGGLFRQYLGYGRGRARNVMKHRIAPRLRQALPLLVFPAAVLACFSVLNWLAVLPLAAWALACLGYALALAVTRRDPNALAAGFSAMVMHLAWSTGFWLQLLGVPQRAGRMS